MKVTKRPVMILIILTLMGTLVPLLQLSASDSYLQENSDSALLERKFLKLYDEDAEFKEAVNEIRSMFDGDEFTDAQWLKYKELFNKVLDKLELPTLDELDEKELALFRKEVERDAAGWGLRDLESQDKGEKDIRLSDAEEIEIAEDYVPRLYHPEDDILYPALNGLWKVYVDVFDESIYGYDLEGYYIIEISIVYFDEDHPLFDAIYDALRLTNWGRIEDVETFFMVVEKEGEETDRVSFIGCELYRISTSNWRTIDPIYSKTQQFGVLLPTHYKEKLDVEDLDMTGEHPILWVNTWNHLLGEDDNNPTMDDTTHNLWTWGLDHGNRMEAENEVIESNWYNNERIDESP